MNYENNPFSTAFGMIPPLYVREEGVVDEILTKLNSSSVTENVFMLYGVRGSGKTVALTAIEEQLEKDTKFIVIDLNSRGDLLEELVGKLYDTHDFIRSFVTAGLNLSKFGIGLDVSTIPPVANIESALTKILEEIKSKDKRLIISIDEATKSQQMMRLAGCFNILSRKRYPVYMIMTGLKTNMSQLEDAEDMTFLRRAEKYEMAPLNIASIRQNYMNVFNIEVLDANKLALLTKGYPFAYQLLGKLLWNAGKIEADDDILSNFDYQMDVNAYGKIWLSLTETEKWYLCHMSERNSMKVSELLEITGKKPGDFSRFRESLREKGIIDTSIYGVVSFALPRFDVFVRNQMLLEGR